MRLLIVVFAVYVLFVSTSDWQLNAAGYGTVT
jgi:hypothetical protein